MALKPCRECGLDVSTSAKTCPHCGVRSPTWKAAPRWIRWGFVAVVVGLLMWVAPANRSSTPQVPKIADCSSDWTKCSDNADLVNNYSNWTHVQASCKVEASRQARYGTPVWPWGVFGSFYKGNTYITSGTAIAVEPDAQFQNGFGAMVHSQVTCTYDLRAERVLSVDILPH
jgi:hypothetical protein